ncbi:MAG TPA: hypothetical protein VD999_03435 [Vitreimonas sp.]|nr:hypothetical protein [Vitreimonas sp.]
MKTTHAVTALLLTLTFLAFAPQTLALEINVLPTGRIEITEDNVLGESDEVRANTGITDQKMIRPPMPVQTRTPKPANADEMRIRLDAQNKETVIEMRKKQLELKASPAPSDEVRTKRLQMTVPSPTEPGMNEAEYRRRMEAEKNGQGERPEPWPKPLEINSGINPEGKPVIEFKSDEAKATMDNPDVKLEIKPKTEDATERIRLENAQGKTGVLKVTPEEALEKIKNQENLPKNIKTDEMKVVTEEDGTVKYIVPVPPQPPQANSSRSNGVFGRLQFWKRPATPAPKPTILQYEVNGETGEVQPKVASPSGDDQETAVRGGGWLQRLFR